MRWSGSFAGKRTESWSGLFLVAEVRAQPLLDFGRGHALPLGVVHDLVAADLADHEVPRLRVSEVEPRDGRSWRHGAALGQVHADRTRVEQGEQGLLFRVVRAGGVAEGRADAAVLLRDQLLVRLPRAALV